MATAMIAALMTRVCRFGANCEDEAVQGLDSNSLALPQRLTTRCARLPEFAVHVDKPFAAHFTDGAGDQLRADRDGSVSNLYRLADREGPRGAESYCHSDHEWLRRVVTRRVLEEQERTDRKTDQPGDRKRAV